MTDSMNFGPEWLRNLSSDGSTTGGIGGGTRYQLSGYRYGREEMLGLYEKGFKPPASLFSFTTLYSEQPLVPLVLSPTTDEERTWPTRAPLMNNSLRGGRGTSLERGGRISRGRGSYQAYGRNVGSYESGGGWGNGEQSDWSPRKDYNTYRSASVDNWRRNRNDDDEDWRSSGNQNRSSEKWVRSTSWRDGDKIEERSGTATQERNRSWHENARNHGQRRGWDSEDLPEWATEQLGEGGGTFDSSGAYHGSDEERDQKRTTPSKREPLQKSSSQHNISAKQQPPLTTSKSAISLTKQKESHESDEERTENLSPPPRKNNHHNAREKKQEPSENEKSEVAKISNHRETKVHTKPEKVDIEDVAPSVVETSTNSSISNNTSQNGMSSSSTGSTNRVEEDFDRLQEDLVSKLVVEEETPKGPQMNANINISNVGTTPQPPPNLVPPIHDQWFYQDPQGDLQGPFASTEMAEWFKAGYFSNNLRVRRQCDNSFYTLGDLGRLCNGNPFLKTARIPPLKEPAKLPEQDLLNLHLLQAQLALRQVPPRGYKPDWTGLSALQQRDLLSQHMLTPQMPPVDLQYLQQTPPAPSATNPLMHIINQMQQANKLPGQQLPEQPPNAMPVQLDPLQALVQQMSLQRIQPPGTGLPGIGLPPNIQNENLVNNLSGLHGPIPGTTGIAAPNLTGLSSGINVPGVIPTTTLPPKPAPLDSLSNANDNDPINSLLRQLQNKQLQQQTQQLDTLWQQNQYVQTQANSQWQQQHATPTPPQVPPVPVTQQTVQDPPSEIPLSMWDIQQPHAAKSTIPTPAGTTAVQVPALPTAQEEIPLDKEHQPQVQQPITVQQQPPIPVAKEKELSTKEEKKKKEQDEKQQQKKEAEEKRKQEQKRLDQEKKAAEEKRKKEEEKRKKEEEKQRKILEKAKKEAEEKRLRELEEKRRLKEIRKAEEEAKKKAEDQRKLEELERERREQKYQAELMLKQYQEAKAAKIAPWSQSNVSSGPSLADIQKAEREKKAEQVLLQQQRAQQQQLLEQQQAVEKTSSIQLSWANKPMQPRQVKSLADIQAEEQERLAKQVAETKLAQQQKEKETGTTLSAGIWHGQHLTWANPASTQWSSAASGFWDDSTSHTPVVKPSNVSKSNSTSAMIAVVSKQQQQSKQVKTKTKKDESTSIKTSNGPATEEFTTWCTEALANLKNLKSTVDIPTFIGFLRDIESAAEVREYCREYLGDNQATQQFTSQFLEKRRSFKPKIVAHKDDMCSPAPALTPYSQHNSDFQEVKGKGKKTKKAKMTKVDSRILGFSVTAAQDRFNVGDRDYVNDNL